MPGTRDRAGATAPASDIVMETSDMNMPAVNPQPARAVEPPIAKVLRLQNRQRKFSLSRAAAIGRDVAARVVPPIIVIALIGIVWEVLCRKQGATLPPPR